MGAMRLVVAGAGGRMGRSLIAAVHAADGFELVGALARPGSSALGQDAGLLAGCGALGVTVTDDPLALVVSADGILDFTTPDLSLELAALAAQARIVHVIGTTGFSAEGRAALTAAGWHATIIQSGNMSRAVTVLAAMVERTARALGPDYDIEIVETHHRMKVDAPSGTALMLGEAAARGRGIVLSEASIRGRDGRTGARPVGPIGFAALRGGTVIGDHSVVFAGPHERIELVHKAEDRGIYAGGALSAAAWGRGRKPGLYSMADVLGLTEG
jgi:4-hydroxy-tetrahydrodipicolinate reductase